MKTSEVYEYIKQNEPIEQDVVEHKFGQAGLTCVRDLMIQNKVSYNLEWKLQTQ